MSSIISNTKTLLSFYLVIFLLFSNVSLSAVKIKGGVITSAEVLKTEKPKKRNDLIYDLKKINLSHLDKKITLKEAVRFENRIGIGAPYDRVKRYIGKTRKEAIKIVVQELENYQDDFDWPDWKNNYTPTTFIEDGLRRNKRDCRVSSFRTDLEFKWSKSILKNSIPQFEKLALLWLDHFSVAFDEYDQSHSFVRHLEFIRRNAIGNFDTFLKESIKDPGIIVYLNNEQSTTQKPNENLAREFLELFSLGEGNYSENEIKNFAKKLPGHSINHVSQDFQYYKYKESGQTLSAFGEKFDKPNEFIDIVVNHPAFGEFIGKKFYNEFVKLGEPDTDDLAILVTTFKKNNFNIIKLFEATISLESFWDKQNKLTLIKSPIELIYGAARTLGVAKWQNQLNISWLIFLSKDFGQDLFNPPNIAGWPTGKDWLAGQLLEKRMSKLKNHFIETQLSKKINQRQISEFKINDVKITPYKTGKWLMLYLKFLGTTDTSDKIETFTIGLDANLKKNSFHAIRLDEQSFKIPTKLSYKNQPGRFFIGKSSIKDGTYKKLFNYLPNNKKIKLNSICKYLISDQNISNIFQSTRKLTLQEDIHNFLDNNGLEKNVTNLAEMCFNLEEVGIAQINKGSKGLLSKVTNKYNDELDLFYKNLVKDQLGVETIIINYIPKDFETKEWADINIGFYGVKLNEKFWNGIQIRFGTDINSKKKKKWKNLNRIEVRHGFSNPPIFTSWENSWISNWDGHYGWNSSFPVGPRMDNFNAKTRDEKLLMTRLLQSMEHILENKNSSRHLKDNIYVQNWLRDRISESKSKWNLNNGLIPNTKIYSFASNDNDKNYKTFQCGAKRAGIDFVKVRYVDKKLHDALPSGFTKNLEVKLTTLLLPEVDLGIDEDEFMSILSYEGYQLK
ncbi:MAG: DUF1800 family protein [Candidatus Puniceispirillales bacterium]